MASGHNPFPMKAPRGRPEYWTFERIEALSEKLKEYVSREEVYDLAMFRVENELTAHNVRHICDKCPDFARVYELAKVKIGSIRQKNALYGTWKEGTIHRDDWKYCPEVLAYQREMKDKETASVIPAQLAAQATIAVQAKLLEDLQKQLSELTK